MPPQKQPLPQAELDVLKVLWHSNLLTVREITEAIYGEPTTSNIGTVHKLIQRLEAKGYLKRDRRQHSHRFSPKVSRDAVVGTELEALARRIADGSLVPFVTHLVQAKSLSKKDKEEIRRLLEE